MRIYILTHLAELDGSGRLKVLGAYSKKEEADAALDLLKAADVRGEVMIEQHQLRSISTATYGALQSAGMTQAEAEKRAQYALDQYRNDFKIGQQPGFKPYCAASAGIEER